MDRNNVFEEFQREISYRLFPCDEGIALTATMKDLFHDIFLEVRVDLDSMRIVSGRINFLRQPSEQCCRIEVAMAELIGTTIGKGINKKVSGLFGGSEGCGNIRTLLMGLLPLALNAKAASGGGDPDETLERVTSGLAGTCIGHPINK